MTATARQIPLDLGHRPAFGRDDFLISPGNAKAVAWIDRWPDWPAPALVIHGPAACGKSHLAAVWKERVGAVTARTDNLPQQQADVIFAAGKNIVLDPIDPWLGDRAAETVLFHLYNLAREEKGSLLLTMRAAPAAIAFALPDLSSRLRAAPAAAIDPPDDELLAAVLVKLFSDRQLQVGQDVLAYLLPRMERSLAAARDLVEKTDRLALSEKRAISVPLVRQVLMAG